MWVFTHFWPKMGFLATFQDPGPRFLRGFTSTPRAGALSRVLEGSEVPGPERARNPRNRGFWGIPRKSRISPVRGPGGVPAVPGGYRAPPRGVDVKPPSAAGREVVPGPPRPLAGSRAPPGVRDRAFQPLRGPCPGVPPSAGVVLHQPLAAGPCPRPGRGTFGPRGPRSPGRRAHPRPVQGQRDRTACPGRVRLQGGIKW